MVPQNLPKRPESRQVLEPDLRIGRPRLTGSRHKVLRPRDQGLPVALVHHPQPPADKMALHCSTSQPWPHSHLGVWNGNGYESNSATWLTLENLKYFELRLPPLTVNALDAHPNPSPIWIRFLAAPRVEARHVNETRGPRIQGNEEPVFFHGNNCSLALCANCELGVRDAPSDGTRHACDSVLGVGHDASKLVDRIEFGWHVNVIRYLWEAISGNLIQVVQEITGIGRTDLRRVMHVWTSSADSGADCLGQVSIAYPRVLRTRGQLSGIAEKRNVDMSARRKRYEVVLRLKYSPLVLSQYTGLLHEVLHLLAETIDVMAEHRKIL